MCHNIQAEQYLHKSSRCHNDTIIKVYAKTDKWNTPYESICHVRSSITPSLATLVHYDKSLNSQKSEPVTRKSGNLQFFYSIIIVNRQLVQRPPKSLISTWPKLGRRKKYSKGPVLIKRQRDIYYKKAER